MDTLSPYSYLSPSKRWWPLFGKESYYRSMHFVSFPGKSSAGYSFWWDRYARPSQLLNRFSSSNTSFKQYSVELDMFFIIRTRNLYVNSRKTHMEWNLLFASVVVQQLFTLLIVLCFLLDNTYWKSPYTGLEISQISLGKTPIIERIREPVWI